MSVLFNATGTTARNAGVFYMFNGTITLMIWAYYLGNAEGSTAFLISPTVSDNTALGSSGSPGSEVLLWARGFSVLGGQWVSNESISHNMWHCIILTYDDSSVTNDPSFYVITPSNSVSVVPLTTSELIAPDGTASTSGNGINFGNSEIGSVQTFNGYLSHGQIWNRILSLGEIQQAAYFPGSVLYGLEGWWPMHFATSVTANNPGYCPDDQTRRNLTMASAATGIINPPVGTPFGPYFGQHNWISK